MSLKTSYILIFVFAVLQSSLAQTNATKSLELLNEIQSITARNSLSLNFGNAKNNEIKLYCSNSYGSILVSPKEDRGILSFNIPQEFSIKSGVFKWKIIGENENLEGEILIKPQPQIKSIESYLGPPSIEAGGKDFTTLVVIPIDHFDNALQDSTAVKVKHQFLGNRSNDDILTKNGIGFIDIFSKPQFGRMLISSECLDLNSKEYDVNVMPAIPTNFEIDYSLIHDFADGNQITTFTTSTIRDKYGNIVSDGTLVSFFITNDSEMKSKVSGSTINGIAKAKILNPYKAEQWSVKAYVEGMAESNTIALTYKQAVKDFEVKLSEDSSQIAVGPLQSFMNQRIPDGFRVKLEVHVDNKIENEAIGFTSNGEVTFDINRNRYLNKTVKFVIEAAGISKTISDITYE